MNKRAISFIIGYVVIGAVVIEGFIVLGKKSSTTTNKATSGSSEVTGSEDHHKQATEVAKAETTGEVANLIGQSKVAIDIKDFTYSKQNIRIKKGTTVTWTNRDTTKHNVMKEHVNSNASHDAPTKDKVQPDVLAGQLLAQGESYSFRFNEVGSNPYHCSPHPYMKGSVEVVE